MKLFSALSVFSVFLCNEVSSNAHTAIRTRTVGFEHKIDATLTLNLPGLSSTTKEPDDKDLAIAKSALMKAYNQVYKGTDFAMLDAHLAKVEPDNDAEGKVGLLTEIVSC